MDKTEESWALIGFTTLAPLSVGGLFGVLALGVGEASTAMLAPAAVMLAVAAVALAISLLHLGRPLRAPRALLRWSSSWLSREVVLFGLYLASLTAYVSAAALDLWGQALWILAALAAFLGLLGVYATGMVYHLRARPAWDHWTAAAVFPVSAASSGLLFGLAASQVLSGLAPHGRAVVILSVLAAVALVLGLAVAWSRLAHLRQGSEEERVGLHLALGRYRWAIVLRIGGALCALALISVGGGAVTVAWVPAVLGEVADRVLFFRTVVPVTLTARSGVRPVVRVITGPAGR